MNFADLYRYANQLGTAFVSVEKLRLLVKERHQTVEDVQFWECELDQHISLGHMVLYLERSSPYDEGYICASIRFDRRLDRKWRRFVCCKELMHVFDTSLAKTSDKERFIRLLNELENNPISVQQSEMFKSERNAEWMALMALCPSSVRERYLGRFQRQEVSSTQIANELLIPDGYVSVLMSEQYSKTLELLTGESNGQPAKGRHQAGP